MNKKLFTSQKFKKIVINILSSFAILAIAFPVTGNALAQEPALPEGWHDGTEGTVNAAGCSVFGWTVDPDDRSRDLQVQILANGSPVATTTANLLREDVEACTEGTCGFNVALWDLIPAGVENLIRVQAYDEETAAWVDLSGTPKSVTCWGYPEGFHDGAEGVVDANSCSAFGWVTDPDNRDRDLQVQILADGNIVAETVADILRPDVSACTGGTCGFGLDLWGLISPDEEHQITAQAYDEESATWMNLEATPKLLTCQTPPPPTPWLIAFPDNDAVESWEWPDGATVTLTINNAPGLSWSGTAAVTTWGDPRTYLRIEFVNDYNLQVDDVVTLTDEFGTSTTHTVQNLSVTEVNGEADTVSGTANLGAVVQVWPHGQDYFVEDIAEDGTWLADFGALGFHTIEETGGRSQIVIDGNATAVDWNVPPPPPGPGFVVFPEWEWFDGNNWPDGASVKITVQGKSECKVTKESWGGFFNGSFGEGCDIAIGDLVKFTDGKTTQTHVVRNLAITAVDPGENTITGTADIGTTVYVWPHDGWFGPLQTVADNSGLWQVDLDDAGYDLQEGASGRSEIRDETGTATAVDWYVPNPRFTVFPMQESLELGEWPIGADVHLSIEDPQTTALPDFEGNYTVQTANWDPNQSYLWIDIRGLYDIKAGDVVTMTHGTTTRTYTVQNLTVDEIDVDEDAVTGTADEGAVVNVWPHATGEQLQATANSARDWGVDFTGKFDLVPGEGGRAEIRDSAGNGTAVDWYVPNPRFTIFPLWQWYDGLDWPDGATVNITVADKPACNVTKTSWNYFFNGGFAQSCHVGIGDSVTFTDGTTTRTHVVRNLAITAIDVDKDTIRGTADAGTTVYVWPHDGWFEPLQVIANSSGAWRVDLGDVGYDILEGASGRAEIRDDMGNATAVDWNLNARIIVHTTDDWFRAEGFAPNTSLKFRIYDAPGGKRLLKSVTAKTDSGGTVTHWVGNRLDVVPGNYVIVSDGKTTRDMVLEALTFDVFDTSQGILQGMAPEPFGRTVSVGIGCWQRDDLGMNVTTDANGAWMVNFGAPVPNDFGCVYAWIYETDGDVSEARPEQIIWWSE